MKRREDRVHFHYGKGWGAANEDILYLAMKTYNNKARSPFAVVCYSFVELIRMDNEHAYCLILSESCWLHS